MGKFRASRAGAVALVLIGIVTLVPAASASAASQSNHNPNNYLALGDSVTYGFNPLLLQPGVNPNVFVGFPELASSLFRPRLKVSNASCPGETSSSLISGTGPDEGCQAYRHTIGPLHVRYSGSQLAYADGYVAANPRTSIVSMMIGANDLFLLLGSCSSSPDPNCVADGLPQLLSTLKGNLETIYSSLRQAGFDGTFVAVTYYSTNYADPVGVAIIGAINAVLAQATQAFGGKVADGFGAFQQAALPFGGNTCAAGLLIHLTPTTCDVHPTPAGAALLAEAFRNAV